MKQTRDSAQEAAKPPCRPFPHASNALRGKAGLKMESESIGQEAIFNVIITFNVKDLTQGEQGPETGQLGHSDNALHHRFLSLSRAQCSRPCPCAAQDRQS